MQRPRTEWKRLICVNGRFVRSRFSLRDKVAMQQSAQHNYRIIIALRRCCALHNVTATLRDDSEKYVDDVLRLLRLSFTLVSALSLNRKGIRTGYNVYLRANIPYSLYRRLFAVGLFQCIRNVRFLVSAKSNWIFWRPEDLFAPCYAIKVNVFRHSVPRLLFAAMLIDSFIT